MSLSAGITIELNTLDVIDVVECLVYSGWSIFDVEGKISFLPVDDDGYYSWTTENLTENQIKSIIKTKTIKKEVIGLLLYKYDVCTSLLFLPSNEIIAGCDINRKIIHLKNGLTFTDVNWYINQIVVPLIINGYKITRFEYVETR